jgi:hypothetical protein
MQIYRSFRTLTEIIAKYLKLTHSPHNRPQIAEEGWEAQHEHYQ